MELVEKYRLRYNFEQYNVQVYNMLNELLQNSTATFYRQNQRGQIIDIRQEYNSMIGFIENVEEYLFYHKGSKDFNHILNSISKVKVISVLPKNERRIYGKAMPLSGTILINPNLRGSQTLTSVERTRLYVAHELGHIVNDKWVQSAENYYKRQVKAGNITQDNANLISEGIALLDEAITQDRAENFAYYFARKTRPAMRLYKNNRIFDGSSYKTNFDFYGELQEPATMFARTLRGIGSIKNDAQALNVLSRRALNPNFFTDILTEYSKDNQLKNLYPELMNMGVIKKSSYELFGYDSDGFSVKSRQALENLTRIASSLRDYREPFEGPDNH